MSFTFDIKGIDKLEKKLKEVPNEAKAAVHGVLSSYVVKIHDEQIHNAQGSIDRGSLIKGIGWVKVDEINFMLFSQAPYSAYLEFGTRKKFTPIAGVDASQYRGGGNKTGKSLYQLIYEWVKRKGIAGTFSVKTRKRTGGKSTQEKQDRRAAWLIYQSILKNGIKPQPFFFQPFLSKREEIKRAVEQAINKL